MHHHSLEDNSFSWSPQKLNTETSTPSRCGVASSAMQGELGPRAHRLGYKYAPVLDQAIPTSNPDHLTSMARTKSKRSNQVVDPETIGLLSCEPENQYYPPKKGEVPCCQCRTRSSALGESGTRPPSQQRRGIPPRIQRECGEELRGLVVSRPSILSRDATVSHTGVSAETTRQDWLGRLRPRPVRAPSIGH